MQLRAGGDGGGLRPVLSQKFKLRSLRQPGITAVRSTSRRFEAQSLFGDACKGLL